MYIALQNVLTSISFSLFKKMVLLLSLLRDKVANTIVCVYSVQCNDLIHIYMHYGMITKIKVINNFILCS